MAGFRKMITRIFWCARLVDCIPASQLTSSPRIRHQDAVEANGLYLMATFFMGEAVESPVRTQLQRDKVIGDFTTQVRQYSTHPALLIWSFGNELNGVWNGYLQQVV